MSYLQFNPYRNEERNYNKLKSNAEELLMRLVMDGKVQIGTPSIDGAKVAATVLSHLKGDKVIVFKKKRRKGYQKSNGHRQQLTQILVQGILGKGETLKDEIAVSKKAVKAETAELEVKAKKAAPKKAAPKTDDAPKKKAAPKKAAKKTEE